MLPVQYADYAIWQRTYMRVLDSKLKYWKTTLEGVAPLQLPTDHERPVIQNSKAQHTTFISVKLSDQLQALSHSSGKTLYMTLLAAFNALLYRYSGQEDITIDTTGSRRNQQELEGLIGFINTLVLRTHVSKYAVQQVA